MGPGGKKRKTQTFIISPKKKVLLRRWRSTRLNSAWSKRKGGKMRKHERNGLDTQKPGRKRKEEEKKKAAAISLNNNKKKKGPRDSHSRLHVDKGEEKGHVKR